MSHTLSRTIVFTALLGSALLACGNDAAVDSSRTNAAQSEHLDDATTCELHDAISRTLGCRELAGECTEPPAACEELARAWLACVERDLGQCYCEADEHGGELNCEGSFKPDEGAARCRDQYARFEGCLDEQGQSDE